jgi:two-component system NarL family sensor kinase
VNLNARAAAAHRVVVELQSELTELAVVEERSRLAREIHDTLAQGLTGVALRLESADALLEAGADPARVREAVRAALDLTRANLEEARRSVLDLRAAPLEGRTLAEALAALASEWSARGNVTIAFKAIGGTHPLPSRVEVGLYRIAQEALTNIAQHAAASRARLTLTTTPDHVQLDIRDNGGGFEATALPEGHFGLLGMRERAKLLGGHLRLESAPNQGAHVEVSIPLEPRP